jgi:hypothetical protein
MGGISHSGPNCASISNLSTGQGQQKATVMSQYNPNLNDAVVRARLQARVIDAGKYRLAHAASRKRRPSKPASPIRGLPGAGPETLRDPRLISGEAPIGPIR